jgi:hypothetical protein
MAVLVRPLQSTSSFKKMCMFTCLWPYSRMLFVRVFSVSNVVVSINSWPADSGVMRI